MEFGNVGLELIGGGFRGCRQVGLPLQLFRRGIWPPKVIVGVSIGAINGAELVSNGPESMMRTWLRYEQLGPCAIFNWRHVPFRLNQTALFSDNGLDLVIRGIDIKKIIDSPTDFAVVVSNKTTGRQEVFSNRDPECINDPEMLLQAIKASASLPGFLPPVKIKNCWYADGFLPYLEPMTGCDNVFVVLNDNPMEEHPEQLLWPRQLLSGIHYVLDNAITQIIDSFIEHHPEFDRLEVDSPLPFFGQVLEFFKGLGRMVGVGAPKKGLFVVSPNFSIPSLTVEGFRKGDISLAIQQSIRQAEELLKRIES